MSPHAVDALAAVLAIKVTTVPSPLQIALGGGLVALLILVAARYTRRSTRRQEPRPVRRTLSFSTTTLSDYVQKVVNQEDVQPIQTDEKAHSIAQHLTAFFGVRVASMRPANAPELMRALRCCLPKPPEPQPRASLTPLSPPPPAGKAEAAPKQICENDWVGHWVLRDYEHENCEALLTTQRVPYLVRKVLMRIKPERKFKVVDGELVMMTKTLTGGFLELSTEEVRRRAATWWARGGHVARARGGLVAGSWRLTPCPIAVTHTESFLPLRERLRSRRTSVTRSARSCRGTVRRCARPTTSPTRWAPPS